LKLISVSKIGDTVKCFYPVKTFLSGKTFIPDKMFLHGKIFLPGMTGKKVLQDKNFLPLGTTCI